jgi:hypothetical protein
VGVVRLYCVKCGTGQDFPGPVPVVCPACTEVTEWSASAPYSLNLNDERFLKSIHVKHGKTD